MLSEDNYSIEKITPSMFRQMKFCERFFMYLYCGEKEIETVKMNMGKRKENYIKRVHRQLNFFQGLNNKEFKITFNFSLSDPELSLVGVCDALALSDDVCVIIEIKFGKSFMDEHVLSQLRCYCYLAKKMYSMKKVFMAVYNPSLKKSKVIEFDEKQLEKFNKDYNHLNKLINGKTLPNANANLKACLGCFFENICNDRF